MIRACALSGTKNTRECWDSDIDLEHGCVGTVRPHTNAELFFGLRLQRDMSERGEAVCILQCLWCVHLDIFTESAATGN